MAENARGSLSSNGEKLCLINFDQRNKVIYPKYSHLSNKRGGLNKREGLAEYILLAVFLLRQIWIVNYYVKNPVKNPVKNSQ